MPKGNKNVCIFSGNTYVCDVCGYTFSSRSEKIGFKILQVHYTKTHPSNKSITNPTRIVISEPSGKTHVKNM